MYVRSLSLSLTQSNYSYLKPEALEASRDGPGAARKQIAANSAQPRSERGQRSLVSFDNRAIPSMPAQDVGMRDVGTIA